MTQPFLLAIGFAMALVGCTASVPPQRTQPTVAASPSPNDPPGTATATVIIDGRSYLIAPAPTTAVWRNFMPGSPASGLIASIRVVAADGGGFPREVTADWLWVEGPSVWGATPTEVRRAPEAGTLPSQIEVVARDGPDWEPGTRVDVVIRLRSGASTYYVQLTGLTIDRAS